MVLCYCLFLLLLFWIAFICGTNTCLTSLTNVCYCCCYTCDTKITNQQEAYMDHTKWNHIHLTIQGKQQDFCTFFYFLGKCYLLLLLLLMMMLLVQFCWYCSRMSVIIVDVASTVPCRCLACLHKLYLL